MLTSLSFILGTMIGAYAFDATTVYTMNKDHELYRQWVCDIHHAPYTIHHTLCNILHAPLQVPLMDDEDPEDTGVQGYLKISVQIIGPGEKVKVGFLPILHTPNSTHHSPYTIPQVHDEEAERAAEIARESKAGSDISSLLLKTPTIIKGMVYGVWCIGVCDTI
ncbi:hypothetical protein EON63_13280 [archaeon]|nr:MAG: hypothetical protein EON63_13280 [archaeon]